MPEPVVLATLLGIGEDLVSFVQFLESLLSLFVARIAVRMKLNS